MLARKVVNNLLNEVENILATYEVVVCEVGKVGGLDTQVLEGLC